MGWQYDAMAHELPLYISAVWVCVVFWKVMTGDWGVALALGNLVATLIMLAYSVPRI